MKNLAHSVMFYGAMFCGVLWAWPALAQPPQTTILEKKPARAPQLPTLPTITWDELSEQIGGPTTVTLGAAAMPGGEAIDALAAQAPVALTVRNRALWKDTQTLTADYDKRPFWRAALDMAQQLSGEFREYGNQGLTFVPSSSAKKGLQYASGAGVFTLKRATYTRSVEPDGSAEAAEESLSIDGAFYSEPKLQWQSSGAFVKLEEARDENDQSLLLEETRRVSGSTIFNFPLRLKPPTARGVKLRRLRGSFHGVVAAQSTNWEVANVLNAKHVEKILKTGATTTRLELQDVIPNKDGYLATVIVSQSGDQSHSVAQLANGQRVYLRNDLNSDKVRLLDDKGRELRVRSTRVRQEGDAQTRITTLSITFAANRSGPETQHTTAPAKFIMRYDAAWRELIVPFAFENVTLP